ncbi:MAG: GntR family transcriptional regulator [Arcobacter sp.]|nr:GntR family transcriptional regulator [Arcobacter sp.]|tara:strand:- start:5340 stop:6731 length:1392 start_codon:yes stop_codon:yes gene_type:complete
MYHINQNSKIALHKQLFEALKQDIIDNYKIDEKLPSIRKVMSMYNLSKNTVESAYSQLVAEGYIDSIPKSGYIVIENNFTNFKDTFTNEKVEKDEDILYDFFPARLQKESFPLKIWKRLSSKVIDESLDLGRYCDKQGEIDLRIEIAKYLNTSRAVKCSEEQIIIGNGFINSLSLLALILNKEHDTLAIEEPGYHVARKVYENHKYKIERIEVNKNGINIEKLEKSKVRLVYLTPSHQYPTGVSIPISNRLKLIQWANRNDGIIIEDDYDSELNYVNKPIPSLQGLDKDKRVVYVGTFSKALSPALRVSYMVLPSNILNIYQKNYSYYDSGVSLLTQKTLHSFIKEGYWDKHLRKIRTQNKKKHNLLKFLLENKLNTSMKIVSQGGGLAILIQPTASFNWKMLKDLALEKKIKVYFTKPRCGGIYQAVMMGFGGIKEEELEDAINIFSKIWFKCFIKEKEKSK